MAISPRAAPQANAFDPIEVFTFQASMTSDRVAVALSPAATQSPSLVWVGNPNALPGPIYIVRGN